MPEPLAVGPKQPIRETEAFLRQKPEVETTPEAVPRQITETEVLMQIASEEEKSDIEIAVTQAAEPETAEQENAVPDQAVREFLTESSIEQPPAIRQESEIQPVMVSDRPADVPAAAPKSELPAIEPAETVLIDTAPAADETDTPEAAHESDMDLLEIDTINAVSDIEQTDKAVLLDELTINNKADEAIAPLPEHIVQRLDETMASHFEQLEPAEREITLVILKDITEVLHEVDEVRHAPDHEKLALAEENLTELTQELFKSMHLKPDQEVISWFVEQLINDNILIDQAPFSADVFMEEGTHEQLQAYFQTLGQLLKIMKSTLSPLQRLGRLAVGPKLLSA